MKREFLITKFVCSTCGENLTLSYEKPSSQYAEGEPTGAAMVEQVVAIEPCAACMRPLLEMKRAVHTLIYPTLIKS